MIVLSRSCRILKFDRRFHSIFKKSINMRNGTSPADNKSNFDIWALGKDSQKKDNTQSSQQKTIIVVGDHNSGKSSFVKILKAESDTQVKPTGALQYTFIRRSAVKKELVHSYEVAGKNLRGILQSLISKQNYANLYFIIVVDLSTPTEAVQSASEWVQIVKEQVNKFVQSKLEEEEQKAYIENIVSKYSSHEDSTKIEPLLTQAVIIGNKYDLYEKLDPEVRKWISRTLRYISLVSGCPLVYCSIRAPQLTAQVRSVFQTLFFGQNPANLNLSQKDHMKPIFIMGGHDNINAMSLPHPGSISMTTALKKHVSELAPSKQEKKNQELNFGKYKQTRIDSLVAQKQKQQEKMSKDYKIRSQKNVDISDKPNRR